MKQHELQQLLTEFRQQLHRHPELSGEEVNTARRVADFLLHASPDELHRDIGGHGLIAVYDSGLAGPSVMFRCELDALPIDEASTLAYASASPRISHKCGHDGHMAILCGLAYLLAADRPTRGRVSLLFQPAEETGEGAQQVLQDPRWNDLRPDYLFALHNMPGLPKHQLLSRPRIFAAASQGMTVTLTGHTSHAAHPEEGKSPALAMSYLIEYLTKLPQQPIFDDFTLVTVVHALLGEAAFGVTPGYAELRATLRSFQDSDMVKLVQQAAEMVQQQAAWYGLHFTIDYQDVFTAVVNDTEAYGYLQQAVKDTKLSFQTLPQPVRWSEDFGYYGPHCQTAFFGLGSGEQQPVLHHPHYDFPDDIIWTGSQMFMKIAKSVLSSRDKTK